MKADRGKRASYTLEYKLEMVRLVQGGQSCSETAKFWRCREVQNNWN